MVGDHPNPRSEFSIASYGYKAKFSTEETTHHYCVANIPAIIIFYHSYFMSLQ